MPCISVIVPVYKTKKYLEKCVKSLLDQTFSDFELILVDDGSPDDSGAMCDALALRDARIRVIHKENGGLTSARKAGIEVMQGKYVAFVDSDDYVAPSYLEALYTAIQEKDAQLAICGYTTVYPDRSIVSPPTWETDCIEKPEMMERYILPIIGKIYDGEHLNVPGFMWIRLFERSTIRDEFFVSEREVFTEDDIFCVRHGAEIQRIAVVNQPLCYYVQHPESLSNRFRPTCWNMLVQRTRSFEEWLAGRKDVPCEAAKERLASSWLTAITFSIDNAVAIGSYKGFREELQRMKNSELYRHAMQQAKVADQGKTQRLTYTLLRCKCWYLMYRYRKWRLNK